VEVSSEKKEKEGEKDVEKGKAEPIVDEACWIYEQLRRLAQDLSYPLIATLQQECTRASCPEMKAAEWLYLRVAHFLLDMRQPPSSEASVFTHYITYPHIFFLETSDPCHIS